MKSIEAIIFDCDGVIVDSEPWHVAGRARLFERFGIPAEEESKSLVGHHVTEFLSEWKEKYGLRQTLDELCVIYFDEIFAQEKSQNKRT